MAKKRRTPPTPKMPDRVEHYYRAFREDTADGLEAILTESRKTAKRAFNKHHLGSLDLLESEYGKGGAMLYATPFHPLSTIVVLQRNQEDLSPPPSFGPI